MKKITTWVLVIAFIIFVIDWGVIGLKLLDGNYDITTGASQDIKQATQLAKSMVTKYGMSDNIGLICYDNDDDEVFIGRDLAHTRGYSEGVASAIDQEIKRIIDDSYEKAKTMIMEHRNVLDACASLLLEKEKINQQEFEALFE